MSNIFFHFYPGEVIEDNLQAVKKLYKYKTILGKWVFAVSTPTTGSQDLFILNTLNRSSTISISELSQRFKNLNNVSVNPENNVISIGNSAGATTQSTNSIAIGYEAGNEGQGMNAIAIGTNAGSGMYQHSNSIILNNTGTPFSVDNYGFFVSTISSTSDYTDYIPGNYNPNLVRVYYDTLHNCFITGSYPGMP